MVMEDPRQRPGLPRLMVVDTPEHLANQAALEVQVRSKAAIEQSGRFTLALSGGSTPVAMMRLLATPEFSQRIDWSRTHIFWSDERCVPPENADSNFHAAQTALLSRVAVPSENIHRMQGEAEPAQAASDYDRDLQRFWSGPTAFDLTYLGLGPDGHTASLFPGTQALAVTDADCVAHRVEKVVSPWRLTLTYRALNASSAVIFLVQGSQKADIVARVLEGPLNSAELPAQGIAPHGSLTWLLDSAAAAKLKRRD
jgi:6-phosphogluconolactonase